MILPPATLGMLGGGQLGRFFVLAAHEMGYRVVVLDPDRNSPAGQAADEHLCASFDDAAALEHLAQTCAAVTTEFENVPADTLDHLAKFVPTRPNAACVAVAQNRIAEKTFLSDRGFALGPFAPIVSVADIESADPTLFPAVLKVARFGYDGKGQARVSNVAEAKTAFESFRREACVLEKMLSLDMEVSCVLARDSAGRVAPFPIAENSHRNGILDVSIAPARISGALAAEATEMAAGIAAELGYVGVLGVEFFISGGRLLVNEMAPRPHNSGHYTLDACVTGQFEQQVRTLCGLPLGDARQHSRAVMVNLLGDLWFGRDAHHSHEPEWSRLLRVPGLKLHLYRKHHARAGRKMGHFTVLGEHTAPLIDIAMNTRNAIGIVD
ncbi:MAG: 5-(carboxyamino)imidazole ribonucleotide synthase [Methyloversatilis sp.]|nr:5-(carboxyamino)imidazole ribonucleotide synthase [Methyloversatilis sp.]MBP6195312.1 5-(carboxyamino)imidazole ribonucleotide synthase [Methyloversatilis sp.]MBP9118603.1 5-(carboxyamino)imidazole ribonucleotide synthase [Methyloversatilis sp.]